MVLCSSRNFFLSVGSSYSSTSLFSKAPENGIIIAPGSFLSTHSLIFINLLTKTRENNQFGVQGRQKENMWRAGWNTNTSNILENSSKKSYNAGTLTVQSKMLTMGNRKGIGTFLLFIDKVLLYLSVIVFTIGAV